MGRPKIQKPKELNRPIEKVVEPIPIPWDEVIRELLLRPIRLRTPVTEGQLTLIWLRSHAWEMALHWLIRWEWHSKHKIPASPSLARKYEAKGRVLQQLFYLCERCHALQDAVPDVNLQYRHAAYWFGLIYWELLWLDIQDAIQTKPAKKGETKDAAIADYRAFWKPLEGLEANPFPIEMEATNKLFAIALALADKSDAFRRIHWDGFLNAHRSESHQWKSDGYARIFLENGKMYAQNGRGKARVEIKPPDHWRRHLENLNFIILTG